MKQGAVLPDFVASSWCFVCKNDCDSYKCIWHQTRQRDRRENINQRETL